MCGITGIFNQADSSIISTMARTIAYRGPDRRDWLILGNHSLGASRLIITGDPRASGIFCDKDAGLACMINGEIYNVKPLREELKHAGYTFQTDLETEVLLMLYRHWGIDFATKLKGMFAIAILDGDRLILVRDKLGIKPLYYAELGRRILFGSEIKAILAHPEFRPKINEPALEEIAVFGYVHTLDATPFEAIQQVPPGTIMEFTSDVKAVKSFWEVPGATYNNSEKQPQYPDAVQDLKDTIISSMDTVLRHGDHPFGIYLSGGLDSTILTFVAKNILGYPIQTFTLADEQETDDLLAARRVASILGTRHLERRVSIEDYFGALDHFIWHYESIMAGGVFDIHGAMAFHLLSKTVSDHVKVALSGEGADELFGGYYWVYTHPLGFSDRIRDRLSKLERAGTSVIAAVEKLFPLPEDEHRYRRNLFDDLIHAGLSNYHLQSVDRSAGAYGFEVRPAYLYDDIAELALNLPIEYKVTDDQITKRILKDAFRPDLEKLGLDWVCDRQKYGMPAAVASIAPYIKERIEAAVSDEDLKHHPMRRFLRTKMDVYLFNLFTKIFSLENEYATQDCIPQ
ncbi:MAG: asparagine synthase (glutamine-hydrolyzing) [Dehalococcoidia bacterium]|nr:asparagine synthase (glutamine-hydrolyzing) [Dehalococcoidia bacterium]MDD5493190.1 asparagine synthase (glutamine-hydrolyzing) [Dehalococcoidia bacterium]